MKSPSRLSRLGGSAARGLSGQLQQRIHIGSLDPSIKAAEPPRQRAEAEPRHEEPGDMQMDSFNFSLVFGWHPLVEGSRRLKEQQH
ncbi:hypothetical protein [Thiorhodovibrio winogradskyi]|nr:hypothetical protein [Thiorhodovibrio winogradskyi]